MTADLLTDVAAERDLDRTEARALVDGMRADVADLGERIVLAYKGRAWVALGYDSWDDLCDAEFDGARIRLPREQRAEQVQSLAASGLSTRAIGSALGVSQGTVRNDLGSGEQNCAPAAPRVGQDGKSYPASQPSRPSPPAATGESGPAAARVVHTATTREEFIADRATGEVLSVEDWQQREAKPEPRWQPTPASPQALADRDRQVSRQAFSGNLAKHAWFFAHLARTDLSDVDRQAREFLPEFAASYGGVDPAVLRDAARYLTALADAWKKAE